MPAPVFTETIQIAVVVRDLDAAMRTYVHDYGIGPWEIYGFDPGNVADLREDGERVERAWRLAIAYVGGVQWELIEPLDEESVYARFLAETGGGLHHVGVAVPDFDGTLAEQAGRGNGVLLGGEYKGIRFAYLDTVGDLGFVTEIFSGAPGADQRPDATYSG
ncbi:MAG TPA: VOC family protein [Gaiella sp.]|jgi:catechol 2,3-dioxygenase-like lactoylglutathione lyase family enzyme